MPSATREERIRAAVPYPLCGAPIGRPCRAGTAPHDARREATDLRPILDRVHNDRRAAWQQHQAARALPGDPRP